MEGNYNQIIEEGLDIFEFEKSNGNTLKKAWDGFKSALMGTLFVMAKDSSIGFRMNLLAMVIDLLQMLAFPFNLGSLYPWNQSYAGWFANLCYYSKMEFYISPDNQTQNLIIYIVSMFLVLMNLANAATVGIRFIKKQVQNKILLNLLRSVASLFTTVLYMPFLSQFSIIFSCSIGNLTFPGCPTEQRWLLASSAALISLLFGCLSLIVAASFYEQDCTSEDVSARPHARIELFYLLLKGIITIFYSLFDKPVYHWYQIIVVLIVGIPVTFLYIFYLPYYHYTTTVIQAQMMAVYTWCGLCLILARAQNNPEDAGPITLFYVGSVCVWILARNFCDWRRKALLKSSIVQLKNPYEIELFLRFLLYSDNQTYKNFDEDCLTRIEENYYQAERKFPQSSCLKIFVAQFFMVYRNRQEAIPKLDQAANLNPRLDEQFIIYKTRQTVGKDAITLVTFVSYLDSAHRAEIIALSAQLDLWKKLIDNKTADIDKLTLLSKTITKQIHTAANYYASLVQLDPTHKKMLPMYVSFLEDVMYKNDKNDKYVRNLKNRLQDIKQNQNQDDNVVQEIINEPIQFTISLERQSFGNVEKISSGLCKLLLLPKTKIINNSVENIIEQNYSKHFMNNLQQIANTYGTMNQKPQYDCYFVDRDGYIIYSQVSIDVQIEAIPQTSRYQEYTGLLTPKYMEGMSLSPTPQENHGFTNYTVGWRDSELNTKRRPSFSGQEPFKTFACISVEQYDINQSILILTSNYKIIELNRKASQLFQITPNKKAQRYITQFIPNFDSLLIKASEQNSSHKHGQIQSCIATQRDDILRVRLSFNSFSYNNEFYVVLFIQELPDFSIESQRFFRYLIIYLQQFLQQADPNLGRQASRTLSYMQIQEQSYDSQSKANQIINKVHKRIEEKNRVFSPELKKLKFLFLIILIANWGLFISSYLFAGDIYMRFENRLSYLDKFIEIQSQSIRLAYNVRFLEAARLNLKLAQDNSFYYTELTSLIDSCEKLMDDIKQNSYIEEMKKKNVRNVYIDQINQYTVRLSNIIDGVLEQVMNSLLLSELTIDEFDTTHNDFAFWVFQNGRESIKINGEIIATLLMEEATDEMKLNNIFQYIFAATEVLTLIFVILVSIPLIIKAEQVHSEVVGVFCNISQALLEFMHNTTLNKLQMRKDNQYPESKGNYPNEKEIWDEYMDKVDNIKFQNNINSTQQFQKASKAKKALYVLKNGLMVRIIIFVALMLIVISVLQVWLGQIKALDEMKKGSDLVKHVGTLGVDLNILTLEMLDTALSPHRDQVIQQQLIINQLLNSETDFILSTTEGSYEKSLNVTIQIQEYKQLLIFGNDKLDLDQDIMYNHITKNIYEELFENQCEHVEQTDCITFYQSLLTRGVYNIINGCIFDTLYILNSIQSLGENSTQWSRWNSFQPDLNNLLFLIDSYISPMYSNFHNVILSYFQDVSEQYNDIRKYVLISTCISTFLYYFLVIRPSLYYEERKKQLTRTMITLLPTKIIAHSEALQLALKRLKLD